MPITDYKVTDLDYVGHDVESLSNRPSADGVDAVMLKHRFDAAAKDVIAPKLNGLIDALASTAPGSGAAAIGSEAIVGVLGETVREQIKSLLELQQDIRDQIFEVVLGQIPDGSLTDVKLSDAAGDLKARLAALVADLVNLSRGVGGENSNTVDHAIRADSAAIADRALVADSTYSSSSNIYAYKNLGGVL